MLSGACRMRRIELEQRSIRERFGIERICGIRLGIKRFGFNRQRIRR